MAFKNSKEQDLARHMEDVLLRIAGQMQEHMVKDEDWKASATKVIEGWTGYDDTKQHHLHVEIALRYIIPEDEWPNPPTIDTVYLTMEVRSSYREEDNVILVIGQAAVGNEEEEHALQVQMYNLFFVGLKFHTADDVEFVGGE